MPSITQGRVIPDTDKERLAAELKKFDLKVAPRLIQVLREAIFRKETVSIRVLLKLVDGSFVTPQLQTDVVIDLDDDD